MQKNNGIKVGVIMPHRGDRDMFLPQFHKCIEHQTLQPEILEIIDYPPKSGDVDITPRYREGYERMRGKGLDLIAFMEIDDYYRPEYLETMAKGWQHARTPKIFGTNYTIYYHIGMKRWFRFEHFRRSSMMSTFIRPDLDLQWPSDDDPYADLELWKQFKNYVLDRDGIKQVRRGDNQQNEWMTYQPNHHICIGVKHGIGMCGGRMHTDHLHKYNKEDKNMELFKSIVDAESLKFYETLPLPQFPR